MFYLVVKLIHISCVFLSGALFVYRFILRFSYGEVREAWLQRTPHLVDSLLLSAGIILCVLSQQYPWHQAWLFSKLVALLLYIFFGLLCLRFLKSSIWGNVSGILAIVCFVYMLGTAMTRSKLSWLSLI